MLDARELATLLAALLFWQEEIAPHEPQIAQPYLASVGFPNTPPLSAAEIDRLAEKLPRLLNHPDADERSGAP